MEGLERDSKWSQRDAKQLQRTTQVLKLSKQCNQSDNDLKGLEIYLKRLLRYSNDHKTSVYKDSK